MLVRFDIAKAMELVFQIISIIFLVSSLISPTDQVNFVAGYCSNDGNYSQSSTYQANLINSFTKLISVASLAQSHNTTTAQATAQFYCRHGLSLKVCQRCIQVGLKSIMECCPNREEAVIWYEECTLQFARHSMMFSKGEEGTPWAWWYSYYSVHEVADEDLFDQTLADTMRSLIYKATSSNSSALSARGETMITILETFYGTVECNPRTATYSCKKCLTTAVSRIRGCCHGARWAAVYLPSCQVRYEVGPFSPAFSRGPFWSSSSSFSMSNVNAHLACFRAQQKQQNTSGIDHAQD
ncbi:hypothetical protein Ancab_033635 [Ancistrocladus abbreviatus]